MLFIVYFFYKNESHLYSPNEFLFRIWQKKYLNKFRLLALCWPIFFEIGGLSSPGSSRAWIPIFRAQETCLIAKYLVNSSCEGKHELSFWGINQRTCEITRFSAWVAEAPVAGLLFAEASWKKMMQVSPGWGRADTHPFERAWLCSQDITCAFRKTSQK